MIVEKYEYDIFGKPTIYDESDSKISDSAVGNRYMFTGRRYDPRIGLYYYRARYYHPEIGRFLQSDPIGYSGSLNLYQYCFNNPVNFRDPSGEGAYKWLYTGDWNATDEIYEAAVEEAALWLFLHSPVRGGYASAGMGKRVGGSVAASWTMDSGGAVAGRLRLRAIGRTSGWQGGEFGLAWRSEEGLSPTAQFGAGYQGVHGKITTRGKIKLGLNYKIFGGGLILDPHRFDDLYQAWAEMLGGNKTYSGVRGASSKDSVPGQEIGLGETYSYRLSDPSDVSSPY